MSAEATAITSLSLLERVRGADADAWRKLVQLYGPVVFAWARRAGLPSEDAADITQEVWTAVARAINRFQRTAATGTFRGWLWTVTRNKLHDYYRDRPLRGVGGSVALKQLGELPESEPPGDDDPMSGTGGLIHRALDLIRGDFEERTWRAFLLTAVEGRTASEVRAMTGLSVDAVYQAKSRVLKRLREELRGLIE